MSDKVEVFARKASGLTREAGLLDTVYFGIMNNAVPVCIWFVLAGFAWLPGANLTIASLISLVMVVFGFAFVWGILGGSMPRSGGSYVYNSRIIHPVIGLAVSFCNAGFVMLAWIWVLAPWVGEMGIPILLGCFGINPAVAEGLTSGWGLYLVSSIVNISAFLVVMMGMKAFFKVQKVFVTWSLLGATIAGIIILATSHETFVAVWNSYANEFNSVDWNGTISAVSEEMGGIPESWNWKSTLGLMLPVSWIAAYGYIITFIGGEVKSPRKNIFRAQILNAVICIAFLLWVGLAYQRMVGYDGLHALAWIGEEGLDGYAFPFDVTYINIAAMLVKFNKILGFIMAGAFIVADWLWVVFCYIAWSRAAFAWGLDRLGPKWFTDISPRFNQPVKLLLVMFVAAQIVLAHYCLNPEILGSISVEVLQLVSVFGFTAISALIFPYTKKVRHIWDASPYRNWKFLGIPMISVSGFIGLLLVLMLTVSYYINEAFAFMHTWWTLIYIGAWLFALGWYFIYKAVRARDGIDVTLAFKEIPPE